MAPRSHPPPTGHPARRLGGLHALEVARRHDDELPHRLVPALEHARPALCRQTPRAAEASAPTNRAARLARLGGDYPRKASGT